MRLIVLTLVSVALVWRAYAWLVVWLYEREVRRERVLSCQ